MWIGLPPKDCAGPTLTQNIHGVSDDEWVVVITGSKVNDNFNDVRKRETEFLRLRSIAQARPEHAHTGSKKRTVFGIDLRCGSAIRVCIFY